MCCDVHCLLAGRDEELRALARLDADIICLQETKLAEKKLKELQKKALKEKKAWEPIPGYRSVWAHGTSNGVRQLQGGARSAAEFLATCSVFKRAAAQPPMAEGLVFPGA